MRNIKVIKTLKFVLLLIVPILYVFAGFFFHSQRPPYFMCSIDPEYCYLFNGLNISQFTLKVWHVDHPGTPLQLLAALVIRVVHLFHGNGPLLNDVMKNSALYAYAINMTMIFLTSIALFVLGHLTGKYTKNVVGGIFLQMTPFASYVVLSLVFRINPENEAIICFILFLILILKFLYREKETKKLFDQHTLAFAVVAGFTIAVKMTFLPLFFIPFFLFRGLLKKIAYSVASGFAFLICILPVIVYRHDYFIEWIKKLFIHSGKYGGGEANIVDKHQYVSALQQTFSTEYIFTVSFIVFILACIIYQIPYIKARVKNDKLYKVLLGITAAMLLMILLVAKQFAFHYLAPALLPIAAGIWVVVGIYFKKLKQFYTNIIFILLILVFMSFDYRKMSEYHNAVINTKTELIKTYDFIQKNPSDEALVIVPTYYGCPYQQYSIYFGLYWGGEVMRPRYANVLDEVYPNTFFYNGWDQLFHNWKDEGISYIDVLKKYKNIRMYIGDSVVEKDVLKYVMYNIRTMNSTNVEKIFSNNNTDERIYEISYDSLKDVADSVSIVCNADSLSPDGKYFISGHDQQFDNNSTQSSEKALSGKYSSKLSGENKYGMDYRIGQLRKNEHYRISVWCYSDNKDAQLIISADNSDDFYMASSKTADEKNGWREIVADVIVPESMNNRNLKIYVYSDSDSPAYFDDLKIVAYK